MTRRLGLSLKGLGRCFQSRVRASTDVRGPLVAITAKPGSEHTFGWVAAMRQRWRIGDLNCGVIFSLPNGRLPVFLQINYTGRTLENFFNLGFLNGAAMLSILLNASGKQALGVWANLEAAWLFFTFQA